MALKPVSVSQLNNYINRVLSTDPILMNVSVCGEIANLTKHSSGHWYFSLKDNNSKINCFFSAQKISRLRFELEEGMEIIAYGNISVYEKGGYYSLNISDVDLMGEGALQKAFELLKLKLSKEGLFDEEHKRSLPVFPKKVGVVTSPTGAAIKDIITTIKRRNPLVDIVIYPALVQGVGSAASVCDAIEKLNKYSDIDLLIVGRGGGSAEDLWTFNEESVARAIYNSRIPVISAVGHETDVLISDFTADKRAATPTAAAELAVPHIANYIDRMNNCNPLRLYSNLQNSIELGTIKTKHAMDSIQGRIALLLSENINRLKLIKNELDSLNPLLILDRGYAAVKDINGNWISNSSNINVNDQIIVRMKDAEFKCLVESKENK